MIGWLRALFRRVDTSTRASSVSVDLYSRVTVRQYLGEGDPPAMHWKACHPSVVDRFKADMSCYSGHSFSLKSHQIGEGGRVSPSVVCPIHECSFHAFVNLDGWTFGQVERYPSRRYT
jgi:hypothetical protein